MRNILLSVYYTVPVYISYIYCNTTNVAIDDQMIWLHFKVGNRAFKISLTVLGINVHIYFQTHTRKHLKCFYYIFVNR